MCAVFSVQCLCVCALERSGSFTPSLAGVNYSPIEKLLNCAFSSFSHRIFPNPPTLAVAFFPLRYVFSLFCYCCVMLTSGCYPIFAIVVVVIFYIFRSIGEGRYEFRFAQFFFLHTHILTPTCIIHADASTWVLVMCDGNIIFRNFFIVLPLSGWQSSSLLVALHFNFDLFTFTFFFLFFDFFL